MANFSDWWPSFLQYQQNEAKPKGLLDVGASSPVIDKGMLTALLLGNVGAGIMAGNRPGARFGEAVGSGLQQGMLGYGLLMPQLIKQQKEARTQELTKALITETDPVKQKQIAGLLNPTAMTKSYFDKDTGAPKVVPPGGALVGPGGEEKFRNPFKPESQKPANRTIVRGDETVNQEYDHTSGSWRDVSSGPRWNPKEKAGMQVEHLPDGTVRVSTGGSGNQRGMATTGVQPQTQKDVEKGLIDVTEGLSDTHRINNSFDPSFATIGGQWDAFKSRVSDKLGYQLNPDAQKQLEGFTGYRAEAGRVFANTLKKLSGTAVTEPEMKRQEVYLINPGTGVFDGDSPSQVKTKIDKMMSFQRQAIARLNYIRKNGLSIRNAAGDVTFGNISLDRMPGLMKGYGQEVTKQLINQGMAPDSPELIQAVQAKVAEHFGLVQ